MSVDVSKIRPGDEVLLRGVVKSEHPHKGWLILDICNAPKSSVIAHTSKTLGVGDQVLMGRFSRFQILGIDAEASMAWLKDETGGWVTAPLSDLERVP